MRILLVSMLLWAGAGRAEVLEEGKAYFPDKDLYLKCFYNFIRVENGEDTFPVEKLTGKVHYWYSNGGVKTYIIDFHDSLNRIDWVDRRINPDVLEVEASQCSKY